MWKFSIFLHFLIVRLQRSNIFRVLWTSHRKSCSKAHMSRAALLIGLPILSMATRGMRHNPTFGLSGLQFAAIDYARIDSRLGER